MAEHVIREGSWHCPFCEAKNRGTKMTCEACGQTRGEVEFFYEENGEVQADAGPGPDWICGYCDTSNAADLSHCRQCGAAHGEGRDRQTGDLIPFAAGRSGELPGREKPVSAPSSGAGKYVIIAILFLMSGMIWLGTRTWEAAVTVSSRQWNTEIAIEELRPVTKSAWKNDVPAAARIKGETREIRRYEQVRIGTEIVEEPYTERVQKGTRRVKAGVKNLGNGKFEEIWKDEPVYETVRKTRRVERPKYRKDPVYDQKVSYEIDEWTQSATSRLQGTDAEVKWPVVEAKLSTPPAIGDQRPGARRAEFRVSLRDEKAGKDRALTRIADKPLTEDQYRAFVPGSRWKLTLDIHDAVVKAEPLK